MKPNIHGLDPFRQPTTLQIALLQNLFQVKKSQKNHVKSGKFLMKFCCFYSKNGHFLGLLSYSSTPMGTLFWLNLSVKLGK